MRKLLFLLFAQCVWMSAKCQVVHLLSPTMGAQDVQTLPIFTWRSVGLEQLQNVSYQIKIAEYNPNIGKQASILSSLVYSSTIASDYAFQIFYYPPLAPALIDCQQYVWQVVASHVTYTTEEPIVPLNTFYYSSPISYFTTGGCSTSNSSSSPAVSSNIYIEPKKEMDHFVHLVSDSLYIKYNEFYNNGQVEYTIYSSDTIVKDAYLPVHYGLNYLSIGLDGLSIESSTTTSSKIYLLELRTPKGDVYRSKFEKQ